MLSNQSVDTYVWTHDGRRRKGRIRYESNSITLVLDSGDEISSDSPNLASYEVDYGLIVGHNNKLLKIQLDERLKVILHSLSVTKRTYAKGLINAIEDMFPHSTEGFYGRLIAGESYATYIIQRIENDQRLWLTVIDPIESTILESHPIQPYEAAAVSMIEDTEILHIYTSMNAPDHKETLSRLLSVLDGPPPSWQEFMKITDSVNIPGLKLGRNMRETLLQLVPKSFSSEKQEELLLFLAFIMDRNIPEMDPVDYFYDLLPMRFLRDLLLWHFQFQLAGKSEPAYVYLLTRAEKGLLETPQIPVRLIEKRDPWDKFWIKIGETAPDWTALLIDIVEKLNQSSKIVCGFPVTRSSAKRSKQAWKKRLSLMQYGLLMRIDVNTKSVGLQHVLYFGSAYKWLHSHMSWTVRFGGMEEHLPSPQLQVMVMPPQAIETIRRVLPSIIEVGWTKRALNLNLYNKRTGAWQSFVKEIPAAVERSLSPRKLVKSYGKEPHAGARSHMLSRNEARVIDIVSSNPFLANFERSEHFKYYGVTRNQFQSVLTALKKQGVIDLSYEFRLSGLVSVLTIAQGPSEKIGSLADALLSKMPSSLVMLEDNARTCLAISRLPEDEVYDYAFDLPRIGRENEMEIRVLRSTGVSTYFHNLYQRLLKRDGTWNEDVSAFLSQARLKRKGLSESNA